MKKLGHRTLDIFKCIGSPISDAYMHHSVSMNYVNIGSYNSFSSKWYQAISADLLSIGPLEKRLVKF